MKEPKRFIRLILAVLFLLCAVAFAVVMAKTGVAAQTPYVFIIAGNKKNKKSGHFGTSFSYDRP